VKLHTKLGKPIPPAEPQLIHGNKAAAITPTVSATPASSTVVAVNSTSNNVTQVVSGGAKINFVAGNFLNSVNTQPKPEGTAKEVVASAPIAAVDAPTNATEVPMTAATATETALSVVAQWEEEKVIHPVGQDYVEELRGPDGKVNGFNCRLCDCRFNDVNAKDMHLKGRRHRLMYKKKVDPSLVVESKGWPAQRRNAKVSTAWQEHKKGEACWEGSEFNEENAVGAPGGGEDNGPMRPNAPYWAPAGGTRGLRHGGPPAVGLPPPPQYYPAGPMPPGMANPALRKPESSDDRHVVARHLEIYPSDQELESIQNVVSYVERALKLVSDELANHPDETAAKPSPSTVPPTTGTQPAAAGAVARQATANGAVPVSQPQRVLKGVMRVGLLAKGLLLKGDRSVQLVVLCSQPPTFQLLNTVAKTLPTHLAVVASSVTFTVEPFPDDALVQVKAVQAHNLSGDISVQIALTSPVVREEQLAAAATAAAAGAAASVNATSGLVANVNGTELPKAVVNKDRLSTEHCLHALAQLRRAKWFQARANSLQNCVMVIRVVRDFCLRSPIWTNLDFWAMELVVERAVFSAGAPLSPGDAFRRVFETLSAGILLTSADGWSPGIADPCEKDMVDTCGSLSMQEREDITAASQHTLRLVAFRQIYKVLGMLKPLPVVSRFKAGGPGPSPAKKRPRENSQGEVNGADGEAQLDLILKKEKMESSETI